MSKIKLKASAQNVRREHGVVCSFSDDFLVISVGQPSRKPMAGFYWWLLRACAMITYALLVARSSAAAKIRVCRGLVRK